MKFTIVGLQEGFTKITKKRLETNLPKNVMRHMRRSGMLIENEAKKSIQQGTKSGRIYKRKSVEHQASSAGEPPATDTGFLVSNISSEQPYKLGKDVLVEIISKAPYSKHLEFGTRNMSARPFMQPATEKAKPKIRRFFKSESLIK